MKIIRQAIIGAVALSFASANQSFAVEGLHLSVQSSNVVLSWPSLTNETYIVRYRPTLTPDSSWLTLTDYLAAASDTNITVFIHSNIVQYPPVPPDGGGGGGNIMPDGMSGASAAPSSTAPDMLMVVPADGSGGAAPLMIYPVGFDLSGFTIFDPATGESVSGKGYSVKPSMDTMQAGGVQPMDGSGDTNQYTGFYQVARDGVHIFGLTNGEVLSGTMQFPIEFAVGSTDQIVGVTFYDENNSPIIGASAQGSGNYWTLTWNTPMSANGSYNIYAELDFASDDPVVSVPVTVTVSNVISFPNYASQVFGNQMWIFAQTIPDASYEIDIYDESTNYLGSFYDYADSGGYISFIWDLTDGNGHTFDSTNFFGVFTVDTSSLSGMSSSMSAKGLNASSPGFQTAFLAHKTFQNQAPANGPVPAGNSSSAGANQLWVKEPAWTPNNNWVVAYGLFSGSPNEQQNDTYMICGGQAGEYGGVLGTLDAYGLNGNVSPGNSAINGTVFTLQDQSSRTNLLNYLADPRPYENFYFFGHGNGSAIGSYNGFNLTRDQIAYDLDNVPLSYSIRHAAEHPYRFVFIDDCDTGKANFCEAFGILAFTVSTNFFAAAGLESRAFVGFKSWNLNLNFIGWQSYSLMTGSFLQDWLSGQVNVQDCVNNAENDAHHTGANMSSSAIVYGAYDLLHNTRTRPQ